MLDTCVIVAAVRSHSGASRILVDLASTGAITAVLSDALINQYEDVVFRPENRVPAFTDDHLHAMLSSLMVPSEWVRTHFTYRPTLQDDGDELVLEAAINGHAGIVTFNVRHFKPASRFGIRVLTPGDVLRMLRERGKFHGTK